jgi:excisionase family DNA binding protein
MSDYPNDILEPQIGPTGIEPLLKVAEVVEILGCSRQTIYRLIDTGRLEAYDISATRRQKSMIRISPGSVRQYLSQDATLGNDEAGSTRRKDRVIPDWLRG